VIDAGGFDSQGVRGWIEAQKSWKGLEGSSGEGVEGEGGWRELTGCCG
jgi:hypothetical protein